MLNSGAQKVDGRLMKKPLDVICIGRVAVDLYGHQSGGRLEDMQSFAKYLGGSSGNLAAGLARLGSKSSMLSRVGDEQMGRFVREALQREGVDVSNLLTDPKRLTALVILGISSRDSFPHIFYRENCADMGIQVEDFDESYIASARALAITGTHLSTDRTHAAVMKAVMLARNNETKVILDIDYRPVLWGLVSPGGGEERFIASDEVTNRIQGLISDCDIIVGTEEEIHIAGGTTDTLAALQSIRKKSSAVLVLKRGPLGCTVFDGEIPASLEDGISAPKVVIDIQNVLGAGDAFLSGFLDAWLNKKSWRDCARQGNVCGALVVSRHGCTPAMPTRLELDDYLSREESIPRPDLDPRIDLLHRSTTRRAAPDTLCVLAFDHRRQLEDIAIANQMPVEKISEFKTLVCEAVLKVAGSAKQSQNMGVIVDQRYGEAVLSRMHQDQWWIGSPVELPGSLPLELEPRNNIGLILQSWPASCAVKCLVFYHPEDSIELRLEQEKRVRELYADCATLDRELLLEVISTGNGNPCDDETVANVMKRFYNLGVYPAWWKLETQTAEAWQNISAVIQRYDPLCHGVLLLGLDAPADQLRESFRVAAPFPVCKGFAVGRSIFGEAAKNWFDGSFSDQEVIDQVAFNYERMIEFWQDAQKRDIQSLSEA
jgi:5-dehydro-2-deoxygluconokinase